MAPLLLDLADHEVSPRCNEAADLRQGRLVFEVPLFFWGCVEEKVQANRNPLGSLITRLSEARALAVDLERLLRLGRNLPPAPSDEVGGLPADLLRFVASTDLPVLLWGTGGPQAVSMARFIHDQGISGAGRFVHLAAASLKEGDIRAHVGLGGGDDNLTGHPGTAYLEEITNLAPEVQEELIATLESDQRESCWNSLPIRLICSTSRSIEGALDTGGFSERLFYHVSRIVLPIPRWTAHHSLPPIRRPIGTWFAAELKHLQGSRDGDLYSHFLRLLQGSLIALILERTGGNQIRAARLLGVNRNTLRKWMRVLEEPAIHRA